MEDKKSNILSSVLCIRMMENSSFLYDFAKRGFGLILAMVVSSLTFVKTKNSC